MLGLLLLLGPLAAADEWSDLAKRHRAAFKLLRLLSPAQLEKSIGPRLPQRIVIEAGPFDALIRRELEPFAAQRKERRAVLRGLRAFPSPRAGKLVQAAFKTLAKERASLAKRVAGVEASYADVYNRGYMESGEKARRARKLAAVLIPLYRTLLLDHRAVTAEAVGALAAMQEGEGLAWLTAAARSDPAPDLRAAAVRALGRIQGPEALATLQGIVAGDAAASVRAQALRTLLRFKVAAIKDGVIAALRDPAWEVRALAIAICVRGKLVEAAGALIAALEQEDGRLRKDLDDALFALVGVRMYGDVALWRTWWNDNQGMVARKARELAEAGEYDKVLGPLEEWEPGEGAGGADEQKRKGATSAFYGITTQSKRIVFIVDISRSMLDPAGNVPAAPAGGKHPYAAPKGGGKLDIARWQLHRAIHDLPADAVFNILVYSESYKLWEKGLAQAKPRGKKKAHRFVDELRGNGVTNIADPLDRAFELAAGPEGADTLYLLSDGDPNRGRVSDLERMLEEFTARGRTRRLVIHTVGIGEAAGSSFLKELARRTGGQYAGFK
jgi:hypothetical protein